MPRLGSKYPSELCKRVCAAMTDRGGKTAASIAAEFDVPLSVAYEMWKVYRDPNQPVAVQSGGVNPGPIAGVSEKKRQVLEAYLGPGRRTALEICAEFGVGKSAFYKWLAEYNATQGSHPKQQPSPEPRVPIQRASYAAERPEQPRGHTDSREIAALRQERDKLKTEAAALRKTVVLLGKDKE